MLQEQGAHFSKCRSYRYRLWRIWDKEKPFVLFICLNPSTANEYVDDPTIRRCVGFAKRWDYGGAVMMNLFAFCATDPVQLYKADKPIVGEVNNEQIFEQCEKAGIIVTAWGNGGNYLCKTTAIRANTLLGCLLNVETFKDKIFHLALNKTGQPKHPLYMNKNTKLIKY